MQMPPAPTETIGVQGRIVQGKITGQTPGKKIVFPKTLVQEALVDRSLPSQGKPLVPALIQQHAEAALMPSCSDTNLFYIQHVICCFYVYVCL